MIKVGCCGFPVKKEKYYKEFEIVELNYTFYKLPMLKTAERWREEAGEDFEFCVKAFQGITHSIRSPTWRRARLKKKEKRGLKGKVGYLRPTKEVFNFWNETLERCKILDSKVCLIQTPKSFEDSEENVKNAENFFKEIERSGMEIAVELRGWNKESIKELCKKLDLLHCTDPFASLPTYFGESKIAYFRLHGCPPGKRRYSYDYKREDLEKLRGKIESLKEIGEFYIMFNNRNMYENALQFMKLLGK